LIAWHLPVAKAPATMVAWVR